MCFTCVKKETNQLFYVEGRSLHQGHEPMMMVTTLSVAFCRAWHMNKYILIRVAGWKYECSREWVF